MNKTIKCSVSLFVAILMIISIVPVSFAENSPAKLYEMYDDGMLFKQNSEAVFAGTAMKNSAISCELKNSDGTVIAAGTTKASGDGTFAVSVKAPQGGYSEYTVTLCADGQVFSQINHVVFGELWLASGQSNIDLPLAQSTVGSEMKAKGKTGNSWLRFLWIPSYPEYNGKSENVPLNPQQDIKGCKWIKGSDSSIYGFSAVGYFFAQKLMEKLDMPVGVIQSSLSGSTIASWLSREAIDGEKDVKDIYTNRGAYIPSDKWDEANRNIYMDISGNYNKKIAPLKNFRLSGMLWYQGESEVMLNSSYGEYSKQLDLLQRSYSDAFSYDGTLPLVFTQLSSYDYADDFRLQQFNIELSQFQNADTNSRAMMSIYDVDLTYDTALGPIHPIAKDVVGERMVFCAEGLVYGKDSCYTSATVETVSIDENAVYITFKNTGDGLICGGETLKGFSVCGENGIYLPAFAEIIDKDTVRLSSNVTNPVSAAYAVTQSNGRSNLFALVDGYRMPVSPFITDMKYSENLWKDNGWTDCDSERIWRTHTNELAGYYDTWTAENAACSVTKNSAYSGEGGLSVVSSKTSFSVNPILTDKNGKVLFDIDSDLRKYNALSFKIRNNSSSELNLNYIKITNGSQWIAPAVLGTDSCSVIIPADGQWHTVAFDLTKLYKSANTQSKADKIELKGIDGLHLCFEANEADLSIDDFEFTAFNHQTEH